MRNLTLVKRPESHHPVRAGGTPPDDSGAYGWVMTAPGVLRRADPYEGISADGCLRTGAARARVPVRYEPVLVAAREGLADVAHSTSLYLYGSVANGTARPAKSDVDFLTVGLPSDRAEALGAMLTRRFVGLCRSVDVGAAQPADLWRSDDESYGIRVFLRHYCVHLHGPAPHAGLPAFPADARAARGFNGDIARHLERWREVVGAAERTEVRRLGRRVARKTLLAVAGLVSVHDRTWTTDRERAAQRWATIDRSLAEPLALLADWSDDRADPTLGTGPGGLGRHGSRPENHAGLRGPDRSVVTRPSSAINVSPSAPARAPPPGHDGYGSRGRSADRARSSRPAPRPVRIRLAGFGSPRRPG